jgi:hypothetical protein
MMTNETEKYIARVIHVWVWSGFYSRDDVNGNLNDILEEDVDEGKLRQLIVEEFSAKLAQELNWPMTTDCDRLDLVFRELNNAKVIALQNAGITMSDGLEDVGKVHQQKPHGTYQGYCFYHGQDLERAIAGEGLMLAYGDMRDTDDGTAQIAELVIKTLANHGFSSEWEGDIRKRIRIPNILWQRRSK